MGDTRKLEVFPNNNEGVEGDAYQRSSQELYNEISVVLESARGTVMDRVKGRQPTRGKGQIGPWNAKIETKREGSQGRITEARLHLSKIEPAIGWGSKPKKVEKEVVVNFGDGLAEAEEVVRVSPERTIRTKVGHDGTETMVEQRCEGAGVSVVLKRGSEGYLNGAMVATIESDGWVPVNLPALGEETKVTVPAEEGSEWEILSRPREERKSDSRGSGKERPKPARATPYYEFELGWKPTEKEKFSLREAPMREVAKFKVGARSFSAADSLRLVTSTGPVEEMIPLRF